MSLTTDVSGDLPFTSLAQIATNRLLGRQAAATGDVEVLSLASTNGVTFDWATAATLKISPPQDLQRSASPQFVKTLLRGGSGGNEGDVIQARRATGDTFDRLQITSDGRFRFGSGSSAPVMGFYRAGASTSSFTAADGSDGGLSIIGGSYEAHVAGGLAFGIWIPGNDRSPWQVDYMGAMAWGDSWGYPDVSLTTRIARPRWSII